MAARGERGEKLVDARQRPIAGLAAAVSADQQILLDAERGKEPPPLRHQRYAEPHDLGRRQSADPPAVQLHAFRGCGQQAGNGLEKRRLARPIGADDGQRLALLQSQVDAVQRLEVAVACREAARFEQSHAPDSALAA